MKKFDSFFNGYELEAYKLFGSHIVSNGVEFCVWAPHAYKVFVFTSNDWNKFYELEKIDERGVWRVVVEDLKPIYSYKYRIYKDKNNFVDKSDPYAYLYEKRPANASVIYDYGNYKFHDKKYLDNRNVGYTKPMNIYELHLNGFKKNDDEEFTTYNDVRKNLISYLKDMGYNYVELMPIYEYPFDGSWGYQATGFYGTTSRYGSPVELMKFVDECHKNNIGVLLDVVYVHFAKDDFALGKFDGQPCYEYKEQHLALSDWGSYCFDFTSNPVISFLMSSANFYLKEFHFDGLRFDAVSHMVFHKGNKDIGENIAGQAFVKRITHHLKTIHPQCILIAEDSTDFSNVTKPSEYGGLGFDYKWDLGWMNDTLRYYALDPIYKQYHHNDLTFSMAYFYAERFLLPFSHDEVVHSKKTIVDKMWGDYETKFSLCRNLFAYMYTHPGKKLNFEGNEIAMFREFDETKQLDWFLLKYPIHDAFKRYIKDLNMIYKNHNVLWENDYDYNAFKWIDADNYKQSIYSYFRFNEEECLVTVLNMLPTSYENYEIGVPFRGKYIELINSEKDIYNGCNMCNYKPIYSHKKSKHNLCNSINIRIAPYSAIIFKVKVTKEKIKKYNCPHIESNISKKQATVRAKNN